MAQLAQRLGFDLPDALPGDAKLLAHFLQRVPLTVNQPEPHLQHLPLSLAERVQDRLHLLLEQLPRGRVYWTQHCLVLNEVTQNAVFLGTDRRFQRHGLLRDSDDTTYLARSPPPAAFHRWIKRTVGHRSLLNEIAILLREKVHLQRDLHRRGIATQFLHQPALDSHQAIDRLHHMHRNADGSSLIGNGTADSLPDPPGGIRRELVTPAVIKLLHRSQQSNVSLLNQIQQVHPTPQVSLGHADHQAQIGLGQSALRLLACLDPFFQPPLVR